MTGIVQPVSSKKVIKTWSEFSRSYLEISEGFAKVTVLDVSFEVRV